MKLSRSFVNLTLVFSMAIMLFASLPVSSALAYSDGPRDPGTGTNNSGVGSEPWVDPNEITTPGSAYASVNLVSPAPGLQLPAGYANTASIFQPKQKF